MMKRTLTIPAIVALSLLMVSCLEKNEVQLGYVMPVTIAREWTGVEYFQEDYPDSIYYFYRSSLRFSTNGQYSITGGGSRGFTPLVLGESVSGEWEWVSDAHKSLLISNVKNSLGDPLGNINYDVLELTANTLVIKEFDYIITFELDY